MLTENFLSVCSADDDIGDGWSNADFDAGVALLGEFSLEEFVQLGVENTIYASRFRQRGSIEILKFVESNSEKLFLASRRRLRTSN